MNVKLRTWLHRAGFQENLHVPAAVVPGQADSGIKIDPSSQRLMSIPVHLAKPDVSQDGGTPVGHHGIIPRAPDDSLSCHGQGGAAEILVDGRASGGHADGCDRDR
jgi:hypothetical protein